MSYIWIVNPFGSPSLEYDPHQYERLSQMRKSGELKVSKEEFWRLVDDDPTESLSENQIEQLSELLGEGRLPKIDDFLKGP